MLEDYIKKGVTVTNYSSTRTSMTLNLLYKKHSRFLPFEGWEMPASIDRVLLKMTIYNYTIDLSKSQRLIEIRR
jgi:hypothetical protein